MTERIDHAAEAQRILAEGAAVVTKIRAALSEAERDGYGKKAAGCWAQAQAHATLAVAAELRTANLIAARTQSEFPRIDLRDGNSWITVQDETDERIRERLGLS